MLDLAEETTAATSVPTYTMLTATITRKSGRSVSKGSPTLTIPSPRIIHATNVNTARIWLIINASISNVFAIDIDLQAFQCLRPVSIFPPDHRIRCLNRLPTLAGISCQHSTGASLVAMCALANLTDNSASSTSDFASQSPTLSSALLRKNVLDPENVTKSLNAYFPSLDRRYTKFSYAASLDTTLSRRFKTLW